MTRPMLITAIALLPGLALGQNTGQIIQPLSPSPGFDSIITPSQPKKIDPPAPGQSPRPVIVPLDKRGAVLPDGRFIYFPIKPPQPSEPPQPPERLQPSQAAPTDIEGLLDGLLGQALTEVEPGLQGLADSLDNLEGRFGPALQDLAALMDDFRHYEAPTRLPNGDILIRRRADAPPPPPIGDALQDLTRPAPGAGDAPPADGPPPDAAPALANPIPTIDL